MILDTLSRIDKNARRLTEIFAILAKYGLADWLAGLRYEWIQNRFVSFDGQKLGHLTHEARIRMALTELGPSFIKLGQMLSTRADLVGPELADELKQLQVRTPPDPPDVVRQTIETELGKPPEELFAEFDAEPLASASIGQVHRAKLANGRRVVIKVQHHGIRDKFVRDLDLMAGLAEFVQKHVPALRNYRPVATVREFRRTLLRELDFATERRNLECFARHFARNPHVRFPAVHPELCGRRVLTMERLEGALGTDAAALHDTGADLNAFARHAADMYLDMIFRDGFYHADPHPGNYMLMAGGVVGMMDCGMVGRLDDQLREDLEALLLAVVRRDAEELTEAVLRLGSAPADLDREALRAELAELVAEFAGQQVRDFDLAGALGQTTDIVRRYRIALAPASGLLLKTLVMLEGAARQLSPTFSLAEVFDAYRGREARGRPLVRRWLRKLQRTYRDWDRLLRVLPGDAADILHRFRTGAFEVRHEHRRLEETVNRLVLGVLTAALILSAAHLIGSSSGAVFGVGTQLIGLGFLAAAGWLGVQLVRAIWRSEQDHDPR